MKKKILFVSTSLPNKGGIGTSLVNLLTNLDKEKYDITLCLIANYIESHIVLPKEINIVKGSKLMEYITVNYKYRRHEYSFIQGVIMWLLVRLKRKLSFVKYQKWALKKFRVQGQYDVAIAFSNDICTNGVPHYGGSYYCVLNCVSATKKIAWIHNDVRQMQFTHDYCLTEFKNYDAIVNVSKACKLLLDDMIPEYSYKSFYVYNITDMNRIQRLLSEAAPCDMKKKGFTIVTAARMEEQQKRISRIFDAIEILQSKGITDFHWFVLGDGPQMEEYLARAQQPDMIEFITFLGRKSNPLIYMREADIFVLPSLYESFGMVNMEALMSGCPVICTNWPGAEEIVTHGTNGLLTENSSEGLASALSQIISNKGLLEKLSTNLQDSPQKLNQLAIEQFDSLIESLNR